MKGENFTFKSVSGVPINTYVWLPEGEIQGMVQISHGMVETAERYERLAAALTAAGFGVVANDHLGHGRTAPSIEEIGILEKGDFRRMVDIVHELTGWIQMHYPDKKLFLLGHSMGSLIAQSYIEYYGDEISGVILSGTAGKDLTTPIMAVIVDFLAKIRGPRTRAARLNQFQFGGYNKKLAPNRTPADWLSRDEKEVDKYIHNPYCGAVASYGFFQALLSGLREMHQDAYIRRIPVNLPIYLFAGEQDPVGGYNKSIRWLIKKYKAFEIDDVEYKFYPGGRHEMLNETNRDEVTADLLAWLESRL